MLKNKLNKVTDLVIIGGGPAGLSAGIYAAQDKINFLLIEKKESCWFLKEAVNSHYYVDGFTGVTERTTGTDLQKSFLKHYQRLGGKFFTEEVLGLDLKGKEFIVETENSVIKANAVIVANGTKPKKIDVRNGDRFLANINYYCTIDGGKYKDKEILVLGARNSGAVAACYLHDLGCKVTLLELKNKIQAKEKYKKRLEEKKIKIITGFKMINLEWKNGLERCIIKNLYNGKILKLSCQAVFVYIGREPDDSFIRFDIEKDDNSYLLVDCYNKTSVAGVFAAGDTVCKLKQIITACGDGANAYYFAKKYLDRLSALLRKDIIAIG